MRIASRDGDVVEAEVERIGLPRDRVRGASAVGAPRA
jgi:hypothetical protein